MRVLGMGARTKGDIDLYIKARQQEYANRYIGSHFLNITYMTEMIMIINDNYC